VQQALYGVFPALVQGEQCFAQERLRVVVPLGTLAGAVRHGRLGDALAIVVMADSLAIVVMADFREGRPIDRAPIKRVEKHVTRAAETGEEAAGRVSDQSPLAALANGPQHPIDGLRLARARGAAEKHVLGFQHPREDNAADFNIHIGRLGLVAVHAGL